MISDTSSKNKESITGSKTGSRLNLWDADTLNIVSRHNENAAANFMELIFI